MSENAKVLHGDCRDLLRAMEADSLDSCVTDPPYGIAFMGKKWDDAGSFVERDARRATTMDRVAGNHNPTSAQDAVRTRLAQGRRFYDFTLDWAREVYRVLKPGAHLAAFASERTYHRLACAIEDAGFEVRHMGVWVSAQSFPKSLDVSKAIDAAAGAEREVVGMKSAPQYKYARRNSPHHMNRERGLDGGHGAMHPAAQITAPATPEAAQWSGWGTALKTMEPYIIARKPLSERTVAANVLRWGTGALNIDGCRLPWAGTEDLAEAEAKNPGRDDTVTSGVYGAARPQQSVTATGRWPASVMVADLDVRGPAAGVAVIGEQEADIDGVLGPYTRHFRIPGTDGTHDEAAVKTLVVCPKASTSEREAGLESFQAGRWSDGREKPSDNPRLRMGTARANVHPTVKPIALMRHIVRLVTPPGGIVLDPFAGSGSTGVAAVWEGARFVGCELNDTDVEPYVRIARARISYAERTPTPEIRTRKPKSKAGPSSDNGGTLL